MKFVTTLPPTLNSTYKIGNNRYYMDQKAKDWMDEVGWLFKGKKPLEGELKVEIHMYLKRDRDIDSSLKLILDVMAHVGLYTNDKLIKDLHVIKEMDKPNPRMEVEVTQI